MLSIRKSDILYFTNPIALVEYVEYNTDTPTNLIEIIDGHHRIEAIRRILLSGVLPKKMEFWVQIYKRPMPTHRHTLDLFRCYNSTKPFPITLQITELISQVIETINLRFNEINTNNTIDFIKDSDKNVNRPYIKKEKFSEIIQKQINKQLEINGNYLCNDDVDRIVEKIWNLNLSLIDKPIFYFNDKSREYYFGSILADKTFEKAKEIKFMLGIIKLEYVILQCVNLY